MIMELEQKFRIHNYETDTAGSMSPPALFNYLQDIAATHAKGLNWGKENLMKKNQFWVLSRMLVDMDKLPDGGSEIVIKTWPRGVDGIFAMRDFEIRDSGGSRIGGASSAWLVVDAGTRRPVRPGGMLKDLGERVTDTKSLDRNPVKLPAPGESQYNTIPFPVKYSDLDTNLHVNNVRYLQWALDAYPLDFRIKNEIRGVEVNYLSESLPGDEVYIGISGEEDGHSEEDGNSGKDGYSDEDRNSGKERSNGEEQRFFHTVKRSGDNKELCRIRVRWIERKTDKVY